MSEKIQPALTPEEWREWIDDLKTGRYPVYIEVKVSDEGLGESLHRAAAMALHGQPFGFTHRDLALIRRAIATADGESYEAEVAELEEFYSRLAALLPPEAS